MAEGRFHGSARGLRERIPLNVWVLALGLLAWASAALLPSLHRGSSLSGAALALLPLGPGLLVLGLWYAHARTSISLARPRARFDFAPYVLLCGYPISLALSASRLDHDLALATYSPLILGFSLLALAGYLALASMLCAEPETARSVEHKPLGEIPPVDLETRRQAIGRFTLTVVAVGAFGLVACGSWASPAHFREMWGRAAPEGASLTALGAGIAGALALSLVGPGLRAERGPKPLKEHRLHRVVWLVLVALSGLVVYGLLRGR